MSAWAVVEEALARAGEGGALTRFWLRDDDAVAVTPALESLGDLCAEGKMPVLLAVIPAGATPDLAEWVAARPSITPCQHGWSHANHAAPGERACELGGARSDTAVLDDLRAGRVAIGRLFGARASDILVPPWNRIRASLIPHLPELGFSALSTFVHKARETAAPLPELDCALDIIDWRNGRRGRSTADLCGRLAALIAASAAGGCSAGGAIGLLTHHLAHDEAAWSFLAAFLDRVGRHGAARFVDSPSLIGSGSVLPEA